MKMWLSGLFMTLVRRSSAEDAGDPGRDGVAGCVALGPKTALPKEGCGLRKPTAGSVSCTGGVVG